jgi:hypothetical protein
MPGFFCSGTPSTASSYGNFLECLNRRKGTVSDPCKYKSKQADAEQQAANIHYLFPNSHVFTYHNQEEILLRRHQDCLIMQDPGYTDFFLVNKTTGLPANNPTPWGGNPMCDAVADSDAYETEDQFALNFSNPKAAAWWEEEVIGDFIHSPHLDGFYWDCPSLTTPFSDGMSQREIDDIDGAMATSRAKMQVAIAAAGKWGLDMFSRLPPPNSCSSDCTLDWRPENNCSARCDNSPNTCKRLLLEASKQSSVPSVMTTPYAGNANPNGAVCLTPAAVVAATSTEPFLELSCVPGTGKMVVDFASYGTPQVSGEGRFIACAGEGCVSATGTGKTQTYWEAGNTKTAYVISGNTECSECLHVRTGGCSAVPVTAAYFKTLTVALERFSCAVQRHCASFATNSSCDAGPQVLAKVKAHCDGREHCIVNVSSLGLPSPPTGCGGGDSQWNLAVRTSNCQHGTAEANFRQHQAAFLLTRGPQSWMGHGWIAGQHPTWYPEWDVVRFPALWACAWFGLLSCRVGVLACASLLFYPVHVCFDVAGWRVRTWRAAAS